MSCLRDAAMTAPNGYVEIPKDSERAEEEPPSPLSPNATLTQLVGPIDPALMKVCASRLAVL